jgi:hypothetical protein
MKKNDSSLIHWLVPGEFPNTHSVTQCNLASIRLRLGFASPALETAGFKVNAGDQIVGQPSLIIVGKIGADVLEGRSRLWIEQIQRLRQANKVLVALDYTDNHLKFNSRMTKFYNDILSLVDCYICPTQYLADSLNQHECRPTFLIEDGIEQECIRPKSVSIGEGRRILWFGHESNLQYLIDLLDTPFFHETAYELMIVSGPKAPELLIRAGQNRKFQSKISYIPWSPRALIEASRRCQVCIIPANAHDPRKAGASSNRLITSLALGLPTAADHIQSYSKFEEFFVGLRAPQFKELLDNPNDFHPMVRKAQDEVVPSFFPENIGKQWVNCIEAMICRN